MMKMNPTNALFMTYGESANWIHTRVYNYKNVLLTRVLLFLLIHVHLDKAVLAAAFPQFSTINAPTTPPTIPPTTGMGIINWPMEAPIVPSI